MNFERAGNAIVSMNIARWKNVIQAHNDQY